MMPFEAINIWPLGSSRLDTTRSTCRANRARVETSVSIARRVELCCLTSSAQAHTAKMHGNDTSNVSCRDVTSPVEFGL